MSRVHRERIPRSEALLGRVRSPVSAYGSVAILQGGLAYLLLGAIARVFGASGIATWGIQQVWFQGLYLAFAMGLLPIVSTRSVAVHGRPDEGAASYSSALSLLLGLAVCCTPLFGAYWIGMPTWGLHVTFAALSMAAVQLASARLRGLESRHVNTGLLAVTWVAAYGIGAACMLIYHDVARYWLGFLIGSALAAALAMNRAPTRVHFISGLATFAYSHKPRSRCHTWLLTDFPRDCFDR